MDLLTKPQSYWYLVRDSVPNIAKSSKYNAVCHNNNQLTRRVSRSRSYASIDIHPSSKQVQQTTVQNVPANVVHERGHYYCLHSFITSVTTFLRFVVEAATNIPTFIQIILASLSLGFGIALHGRNKGCWYDGGNILMSMFFTLLISATINFKLHQLLNNPRCQLQVDANRKPLQEQVENVSSNLMKLGIVVSLMLLVILPTRAFVHHGIIVNVKIVLDTIMKILSAVFTIVIIAKSESLRLAVILKVSHSTENMSKDGILIRRLSVWEDVGSIDTVVICTDKSGNLSFDQDEVWVGKEKVERRPSNLASDVVKQLQEAVWLNSTSGGTSTSAADEFTSELRTEEWGVNNLEVKKDEMSQSSLVVLKAADDSEKRQSGVTATRKTDNSIQVHFKGFAEVILAMSSNYYDQKGMHKVIADEDKNQFRKIIKDMGDKGLLCIALAKQQEEGDTGCSNVIQLSEKENVGLTLLAIVGLAVQCQTGVREVVELCRDTGVGVKLITKDDIFTAKAIGLGCGILNPNSHEDAVMEGTKFRNFSDEERLEKVDHIQVMARSTVQDKLLWVRCLKQKQHVVAVTGANSEDAPALEEANVGLALDIGSVPDVKQSSDIVIPRGNDITSISTIIKWGRCGHTNIQKVVQMQLTIVLVGYLVSIISAISSGNIPPLWANILLDTLLSLALATKQPTKDDELMALQEPNRIHYDQRAILNQVVWRNIIGQTIYQMAILLTILFKGQSIFGVREKVKDTFIFNCFLLCQVFNMFNARKLDKKNIYIQRHYSREQIILDNCCDYSGSSVFHCRTFMCVCQH